MILALLEQGREVAKTSIRPTRDPSLEFGRNSLMTRTKAREFAVSTWREQSAARRDTTVGGTRSTTACSPDGRSPESGGVGRAHLRADGRSTGAAPRLSAARP